MSLSSAATSVVQSALAELTQAKRSKPTQTSIRAAVDGAISGLELDSKWQLEKHSDRLAAGIESLLSGEQAAGAPDTAVDAVSDARMVSTHSPFMMQVHLAASSASADCATGLACLLAASAAGQAADATLPNASAGAAAATACLAHPAVWSNSAAARVPLLQVAATCFGRLQSAALGAILGRRAPDAAASGAKKGARGKRARSEEHTTAEADPAAAASTARAAVAGLVAALAAAAAKQSAAGGGQAAALAPPAPATDAVLRQHDAALASLLASCVLLHFVAAAAHVAADSSAGATKRPRGSAAAAASTAREADAPVPPVALLAGGLSGAAASRAAVVAAVAEAVAAAGAAATNVAHFKALQHSRGYIAQALWESALRPLLEAQQEAAVGGAQVRVTPWAHVQGAFGSAAWTGPEWAHLMLAARGILRITYHVSKAARKAHVGGGAGGGLLLLPTGGDGPSSTIGALEKSVTAAMLELSTPAALTSWCKGALLTERAAEGGDDDEEGGGSDGAWDAMEEVAHPSAEDGPMPRLLNRKKVSDAAVRQLVDGCSQALGTGASAAAAMQGGASAGTAAAVDGETVADKAGAGAAGAAVEGLAADAELFMVDTEGDK